MDKYINIIIGSIITILLINLTLKKCDHSNFIFENEKEIITIRDTLFKSDTIIRYDTIIIIKPDPVYVEVVKFDTIRVNDSTNISLPIEQKTYKTEYAKTVIEGYKPELVFQEVYPKTITIRDTTTITNITKIKQNPRWSMSIGMGLGVNPKGNVEPIAGIHVGYLIWSK